ncbi:MAG: response regulator [Spirochaetes bacterium]|nr:response regulator [Spirochaetota bacterium]
MKHILAIDDDVNLLKILESQIPADQYSVITAVNGEIGYNLAVQGNPDLILLDIMMPVMDGFEVLKKLQKNPVTRNIPVIMLSSKSKREDVTTAMQMGVVDYMVKPHNINMLLMKIEVAFKYKHLKEEENTGDYNILVKRDVGRTVISFKSRLSDKKLLDEIKSVFNRGFLAITQKDIMVFDLRILEDLTEKEIPALRLILEVFSSRTVYIVAGRYYGIIISTGDFDEEKVKIFISSGDMELELEQDIK